MSSEGSEGMPQRMLPWLEGARLAQPVVIIVLTWLIRKRRKLAKRDRR